ncbi:MAG: DUF4932 domain-containing protein [Victivallaceae bacterium]
MANRYEFQDPGPVDPAQADPMLVIEFKSGVELMSLVFRLAGNEEFNRCLLPGYDRRVREHFAAFADHPAVRLAAEFRRRNQVGYDAVSSFAVNLTDVNSPELAAPDQLDRRWPRDRMPEFLSALRDFVKASDFNRFIAEERKLYDSYLHRTGRLVAPTGIGNWAEKNFGKHQDRTFVVVPALLNGPNNYGAGTKTGTGETFFAIIGIDPKYDLPARKSGTIGLVVHELMHSFVNPMVDRHYPEMQPAAERIFPKVKARMQKQGYNNPRTMMYESFVRAATAIYFLDTFGEAAFEKEVQSQRQLGFLWLNELAACLIRERKKHRDGPQFEKSFPACIEALNSCRLPPE